MIRIDYKDSRPLYEQVESRLEELILLNVLEEDSQMPSVRNLAMELSINPNTIQRAYARLEEKGIIYSVKGRGSFIGSIETLKQLEKEKLLKELHVHFEKGNMLGITKSEVVNILERTYREEE